MGEAKWIELDLHVPPSPSFEVAKQSSRGYFGFTKHAFPGCFVCGPQRKPFDGLRIFPGAVNGSTVLAAPWQPDASLANETGHIRSEFVWSVLDCTGGFSVMPLPEGVAIVLGELSAELLSPLTVDEPCVVLGWPLGVQGHKRHAGSAEDAEDGRLIAKARAVWIDLRLERLQHPLQRLCGRQNRYLLKGMETKQIIVTRDHHIGLCSQGQGQRQRQHHIIIFVTAHRLGQRRPIYHLGQLTHLRQGLRSRCIGAQKNHIKLGPVNDTGQLCQ